MPIARAQQPTGIEGTVKTLPRSVDGIDHQQITALGTELAAAKLQQLLVRSCQRGETQQGLSRGTPADQAMKQIRNQLPTILHRGDQAFFRQLLHAVCAGPLHIRDSSAHHHCIRFRLQVLKRLIHLGASDNGMALQTLQPRLRELQRTMNKVNGGPAQMGSLGQKNPHTAAAVVGQETHRVQRLQGRTGADQQMSATPVGFELPLRIGLQQCAGRSQFNPAGICHSTCADAVTGEQAISRRQGQHSRIVLKETPVTAYASVLPHGRVHGRRGQNGALTGQQEAGQQTIAIAPNPAGEGCGTEWRHHHQIRPFRQLDMQRSRSGGIPLVNILQTGLTAQRCQRHRAHQACCACSDHTTNLSTRLHQRTDNQWCLHGRNASAGSHQHASSLQQPQH